jgi:hypothetical protein
VSDAESLENPPIGDIVRQKPRETIGMSRASWYRHGKPEIKPQRGTLRAHVDFMNQVPGTNMTLRMAERERFIKRYGIPELNALVNCNFLLSNSMAEAIAKWPHERERDFVQHLMKNLESSPTLERVHPSLAKKCGPVTARAFEVGRAELRKKAASIFNHFEQECLPKKRDRRRRDRAAEERGVIEECYESARSCPLAYPRSFSNGII